MPSAAATGPRARVRVLHVLRPAAGGMRQHVMQLATGLAALGFDAEIACPGDADIVQSALAAGVRVLPVPIVGPLRPLQDLEAVLVLRAVIREGRYDVIHAHGAKAGLVGRIAAMLARAPVRIVTLHNDVLAGSLSGRMRTVFTVVERWLARHTSRVIAVSDALRRSFITDVGVPADKVATVHNGLDLAPFLENADRASARERLGVPADAVVLGQAARFAPQKGQERLLAAAVPVLERVPGAHLVLAGDGPLLDPVRRQASLTSVAERVHFPGYVTDVPGFLAALDVFVSAPLSEGLGNAAIEAMATGLPVVSTAVGGVPEVVEDGVTGLLARPGDAEALTDAMARLARDPALRMRLGEAGRERAVEQFSQDRMLERTAAVYREAL